MGAAASPDTSTDYRLIDAPDCWRGCWASVSADWQEGLHQTDSQLFGAEFQAVRGRWIVRWNPLYWAAVLLTVPMFLLGRWVHLPCGQGAPVRDDEGPLEHEIRTVWIYSSDSWFAVGLAFACYTAVDGALRGSFHAATFGVDGIICAPRKRHRVSRCSHAHAARPKPAQTAASSSPTRPCCMACGVARRSRCRAWWRAS